MITLERVTVRRGPTTIVTGLDLEVRAGQIFWVVGPNGAGKSSLLRVMALLDTPEAGRVIHAAQARHFLYFHSEMALPAASTVGAWARLLDEVLPAGCAAAATALLPPVAAARKVGRLSTGERKRLLLDALLRCPGSLLLDEPYEHLSPDARTELTRILEARARVGMVVVATNHGTGRAGTEGGLELAGGHARRLGPQGDEVRG